MDEYEEYFHKGFIKRTLPADKKLNAKSGDFFLIDVIKNCTWRKND